MPLTGCCFLEIPDGNGGEIQPVPMSDQLCFSVSALTSSECNEKLGFSQQMNWGQDSSWKYDSDKEGTKFSIKVTCEGDSGNEEATFMAEWSWYNGSTECTSGSGGDIGPCAGSPIDFSMSGIIDTRCCGMGPGGEPIVIQVTNAGTCKVSGGPPTAADICKDYPPDEQECCLSQFGLGGQDGQGGQGGFGRPGGT